MKKHLLISVVLLASLFGSLPLYAQESCYAQYLREHNMSVLTTEDADDSYDELKKAVLAWQLYGSEVSLPLRPKEEPAAPKQQDTTCVIVHLALVDSTWYMWLSVDPLADKYPNVTPYLYCNGNPIMLIDPDGRYTIENIDGETDYKTILVLPSEQVLEKMPNSEKDAFICTYKQACIEKMPTIRIDNAEDFSNAMVALDGMGAYTESYILSTSHGYKLNGACALSIGSDFFTKEKSDFSQLFEGLNGKIVFITACKLAADITGVELMERFANSTGSTIIGAEHSIPATLGGFRGGSLSISPMIDAICNLFGGYYHNSFKITTGKNTNTVYGLTIDKGLGIRWCK